MTVPRTTLFEASTRQIISELDRRHSSHQMGDSDRRQALITLLVPPNRRRLYLEDPEYHAFIHRTINDTVALEAALGGDLAVEAMQRRDQLRRKGVRG